MSKKQSRIDFKFKEVVHFKPEDLIPYQNNNKKHPDDQVDKIAMQIHKFGFDQPITVDGANVVITGHGRLLAAKKLGMKLVPVIVRDDLGEYEIMAKRIADNAVAISPWDDDNMKFEIGTLQNNEIDLDLTGLDQKQINQFLDQEDTPKITDDMEEATGGESQFIVSVNLPDEKEMQALYTELKGRGLECSLIL